MHFSDKENTFLINFITFEFNRLYTKTYYSKIINKITVINKQSQIYFIYIFGFFLFYVAHKLIVYRVVSVGRNNLSPPTVICFERLNRNNIISCITN